MGQAVDLFGSLDIVVNCAGQMCKKPTFELSADEFNLLHDTHVTGSLRCAKAAGHLFREQHSGCVINLASISSFVDLIEVAAYAAAKNAILGLTRSLANEWAKYGIRVNAIAPGFFPTAINKKMIENTDRGRRVIEHTPMEKTGPRCPRPCSDSKRKRVTFSYWVPGRRRSAPQPPARLGI